MKHQKARCICFLSLGVANGKTKLFNSWRGPSTNWTCTCPPAPPIGSRAGNLITAPIHPLGQATTAHTEFVVPLLQQPPQAAADMAQRRLPCEVTDLDPQVIGQALGESCHGTWWAWSTGNRLAKGEPQCAARPPEHTAQPRTVSAQEKRDATSTVGRTGAQAARSTG